MQTTTMNESLRTLGGACLEYMAGEVAWNDGQRGVAQGGVLSCWGGNITDARIVAEDGAHLPFVRPHNHDEKLGVTDASNILFADGTAQDVLESLGERAKYMGYTHVDAKVAPNQKVVYRVQNAWVPVGEKEGVRKIAPAHYSYQTRRRDDPRNLLVLGTPQGTFVHSDDAGVQKLMGHRVGADGAVHTHWFAAEATDTLVGHAVVGDDILPPASKKARAVEMGLKGMGARANCFVVMSIPNKQKTRPPALSSWDLKNEAGACVYRSLGASSSARVSLDDAPAGTADKNAIAIERPEDEPIVVTILLYNAIEAKDCKTPTQVANTDLALAVADMERIYALGKKHGGAVCKLSELPVMLRKLTKEDVATCTRKLKEDPPADPFVPSATALAAFA